MSTDEIATKEDLEQIEERLKIFLLAQFDLLKQELRLQNLHTAINEERLTKKEVMKLLHVSPNTIDKMERSGKLIVEDWGDGKKRSLRYPKAQFLKISNTSTQAA